MPTNKHASFRYRVLDQCFANRGHRRWTLGDLVQKVSESLQEDFGTDTTVSKRTIQSDISVMRSTRPRGFDAPIVCRHGLYFYSELGFQIEKIPLGQEELDLLRDALNLLRQLPGMPQLPAMEMLLNRISGSSGLSTLSPAWIQFETNPSIHGLKWLGTLYKAIAGQQVLQLHYHPFTEEPSDILLHPYLLKEWHNRWYVFGRNAKDQLWNLALDRIQHISTLEQVAYKTNDLFDPETWFNDIVGVSKPEQSAPVEVEFETSYLPSRYLETKPVHSSQRLVKRENDRYRFSLHVILNYELINELARFGKDLKVLRPSDLQDMLERHTGRL